MCMSIEFVGRRYHGNTLDWYTGQEHNCPGVLIKNMVGVRVGIAQSVTGVSQTCPDSMDFGFSSGLTRSFEAVKNRRFIPNLVQTTTILTDYILSHIKVLMTSSL